MSCVFTDPRQIDSDIWRCGGGIEQKTILSSGI